MKIASGISLSFGTAALLAAAATTVTAMAAVPRKVPLAQYSLLWSRSPFTSKPPPAPIGEQTSAFADWALGGVSEIEGGYMVTLFNIKKPGESQILRPGRATRYTGDTIEEFRAGQPGFFAVTKVDYGKTSWKDTVVTLTADGKSAPIKFDEKLLIPKAGAAPTIQQQQQPVPGQPGQPQVQPGQVPGQQQQQGGGQGGRTPRPRVAVPPPQQQQQQAPAQTQGR